MDKGKRLGSLGEKASEVIVSSLGDLATKCNAPFCCSGELEGSATIVYSNSNGQWNTATFPSDSESPLVGLIEACSVASFGLNGETVTDKTYRDALKLEPDRFVTDFSVSSTSILFEIKKLVPQICNIRTQLNKLNIYGAGGHFRSHMDTPKSKEMFGSLVVCLPTQFTGGSLVTHHHGNKVDFDWSSTPDKPSRKIKWASFFSNVEHEILPVTSGYRVTLTYNLYGMQTDAVAPLISNPEIARFKHFLVEAIANPHFMRKGCILGFRCQHKYVFAELNSVHHLSLTLKGADYCIYAEVRSLGIPVVVKPLVDGDDGYIAAAFYKFVFNENGLLYSDDDDYDDPAQSINGYLRHGEYLGNEASIEFFYQEAVILVGVPKWCKQRQALVSGDGGREVCEGDSKREGTAEGKEKQVKEEEEKVEDAENSEEEEDETSGEEEDEESAEEMRRLRRRKMESMQRIRQEMKKKYGGGEGKVHHSHYVDKEFLADLPADRENVPMQLMDCVREDHIHRCLNVLAHATPEEINRLHGPREDCTPLHLACTLGRIVIVELLIWNGANMNLSDANKRTPMQYAQEAGHQDCLDFLVTNNHSTMTHTRLHPARSLEGLSSYPS
ncbi:hypothetical protein EMCRGX_G006045 [Ephydatia muelleri]